MRLNGDATKSGTAARRRGAMRVYSPAPALRTPGALLRDMVHDLRLSVGLAWQLAARDLRSQYRQSLLGYLWAVLPPLLVAVSFVALRAGGVFSADTIAVPYGAYVITGMLLWHIFADAVLAPLRLVTASREMLVRVNFPREAIVLAGALTTLFGALVRLAIIVPVLLYYQIVPGPVIAFAPVAVLSLILAGTCVGLLVTPVGVLYRDVEKVLPSVLMLWMLLTPVAYPIAAPGGEPAWLTLNLAAPLIEAGRSAIVGGAPIPWAAVAAINGGVIIALLAGWLLLRLAAPHLVARLGI
jgi:lipopolysaccharide transport system permease protein